MLPLPKFCLEKPCSLAELKSLLAHATPETKIIAGGTDLLPNLKHQIYDTKQIISLGHIPDINKIYIKNNFVYLSAMTKLQELENFSEPIISQAASQIASPQIRAMATVGGNICLDTRCVYINQSEFWRRSLGYCLKKDGCICHVVPTGKRCVAAASNDLALALLALDAQVTILSPKNTKIIYLRDLYTNNGENNLKLSPQEIILNTFFKQNTNNKTGFFKFRYRQAIDFSLLSAGISIKLDQQHNILSGILVIGGLVAKPKIISLAPYEQKKYNSQWVQELAQMSAQKCHPQTNLGEDAAYRKKIISHVVEQACMRAKCY